MMCNDDDVVDQLYGLEKYWAFQKYNTRRDKAVVHPRLKVALTRYKRLEDFRVSVRG